MRVVLCGGGTCGHIMPNIALLPYLKDSFESVCYIGGADSMEERIAAEYGLPFYSTATVKLERRKIWRNAKIPFVLHTAVAEAKSLLNLLKPDVVFSKGGYAALPTCLAAGALGAPYVIHESDASLGVANRLTAGKARRVLLTEPLARTDDNGKYIVTGNPIRDEILNGSRSRLKIRLERAKKTVLIVGGSLGAMAVNEAVDKALPELTASYNVIHIHGKSFSPSYTDPSYFPCSFADNIGDYYDAADAVVSRAGAGAIAELNAVGKRVIYIPLPKGSSRGDQEENAFKQAEAGRAKVLKQDALTPETLQNAIRDIMISPPPAPLYDRDTARNIAAIIAEAAVKR